MLLRTLAHLVDADEVLLLLGVGREHAFEFLQDHFLLCIHLFLLFLHENAIEKALFIPFLRLLYLLLEDVLPGIVLLVADPLFVGLLVDLTAELLVEIRT